MLINISFETDQTAQSRILSLGSFRNHLSACFESRFSTAAFDGLAIKFSCFPGGSWDPKLNSRPKLRKNSKLRASDRRVISGLDVFEFNGFLDHSAVLRASSIEPMVEVLTDAIRGSAQLTLSGVPKFDLDAFLEVLAFAQSEFPLREK